MLALVDFPKQIVVALCIAVKYMKSELVDPELCSQSDVFGQLLVLKMPFDIGLPSPRYAIAPHLTGKTDMIQFINRAHMLLSSNTLINLYVRLDNRLRVGDLLTRSVRYIVIRRMEENLEAWCGVSWPK